MLSVLSVIIAKALYLIPRLEVETKVGDVRQPARTQSRSSREMLRIATDAM